MATKKLHPNIERWRPLVEKYYRPDDVDFLLWLIEHESSGIPDKSGDRGASIGLLQLHEGGIGSGLTRAQRADPETNLRVAADAIYGGQGFKPWGGGGNTYNGEPFGAIGYAQSQGTLPAEFQSYATGGSTRQETSRKPTSTSTTKPKGSNMTLPVDGGRTTQVFGPTNEKLDSPYNGYDHFNKGWDVGVPVGTPVRTPISGTVVLVRDQGSKGWGRSVLIRDGSGFHHSFGHLSEFDVVDGQHVAEGEVIAKSGNTGAGTGPHLSYDVRDPNGNWVDPSPWLGFKAAGDNRQGVDPNAHKNRLSQEELTEIQRGVDLGLYDQDTADDLVEERQANASPQELQQSWYDWAQKNTQDGTLYRVVNKNDPLSAVVQIKQRVETDASIKARQQWEEDYGSGTSDADRIRRGGDAPDKPEPVYADRWVDDDEASFVYRGYVEAEQARKSAAERVGPEGPAEAAKAYVEVDPSSEASNAFDKYMSRVKSFSDQSEREAAQAQRGNEYNMRMTSAMREQGGLGFSDLYVGTPRKAKLSQRIQPYIDEGIEDPDYLNLGNYNRSNFGMPYTVEQDPIVQPDSWYPQPYPRETSSVNQPVRGYAAGTPPQFPGDDLSDIPDHIRAQIGRGSIRVGLPKTPGIPTGTVEGAR